MPTRVVIITTDTSLIVQESVSFMCVLTFSLNIYKPTQLNMFVTGSKSTITKP